MEAVLVIHIVAPLASPFVVYSFRPPRLRVVLIEAVNLPKIGTGAKPVPDCAIQLIGVVA
jgi:hypothetical protein